MAKSDDASARRGGHNERNAGPDQAGYRNPVADRTWSQSRHYDPREAQRPSDAYRQPAPPPRASNFSGHSPQQPGRYPDQPQHPQQSNYSRFDYQQAVQQQDDRLRREPPPGWDVPHGRHAAFEPPAEEFRPQAEPPASAFGGDRGYAQAHSGYPVNGGRDSLYDTGQPAPPPRPGYGVEPLYDEYSPAPGFGADDLYDRGPETQSAQAPRNESRPSGEYERALGARIAREAPSTTRFYLPDEQPGSGFGHQPASHEQIYSHDHYEPQEAPAQMQGYSDSHAYDDGAGYSEAQAYGGTQGYGDQQAYADSEAYGSEVPRPLDDEPAWGDEPQDTAAGHDGYRGGLPVEARDMNDELDADFFSDEEDFDHEEPLPPRKSRKKLIAAVLMGAVAIGGGSAYVYKTVLQDGPKLGPDGTPVVRADSGPVKETPSDPGGREFGGGEKTIYDRLTPDGPVSGSPPETQTAALATESATDAAAPSSSGGNTLEDRIEEALRRASRANGESAPATAAIDEPVRAGPDQPIVVRSETYRPDGTRLETNAIAPGAPRAVMDTSNLPPPFGPGPGGQGATASVSPAPGLPGGARPPVQTIRAAPENAESASPAAPERPSLAASRAEPPKAAERPAPAPAVAAAPATRPAAPAPAVRTAALTGGHFVQMRASNDEKRALAEVDELNNKFGVVLGDVPVSSKAVDLGEKGVWFRLLAGPLPSKEEAVELCNKLKGAGLPNCLVRSE